MGAANRRRRPVPRRVFWVRRGLMIAVVALPIWGVTALIGGGGLIGGDNDSQRRSANAEAAAEEPAPQPAQPAQPPEPIESPEPEVTAPPEPLEPEGPCEPASVELTVTAEPMPVEPAEPDASSAEPEAAPAEPLPPAQTFAGDPKSVYVQFRSMTESACTLTVDGENLVLVVGAAGTEPDESTWSSEHCPAALGEHTVVVQPRLPVEVEVTWPGVSSEIGCPELPAPPPVEAGAYEVTAALLGGEPAGTEFMLVPPPPPPPPPPPAEPVEPG